MNLASRFELLYQYNIWASNLYLPFLKQQISHQKRILMLFSHITIAQILWLSRVSKAAKPAYSLFETIDMDRLESQNKQSNLDWIHFVQSLTAEDLARDVYYTDTKGNDYSTALADILTHVANHGTHHRSQISQLLRQEGVEPPASDYIFFIRKPT